MAIVPAKDELQRLCDKSGYFTISVANMDTMDMIKG
jgi:hypothetical protein